jgi:protein NRD1
MLNIANAASSTTPAAAPPDTSSILKALASMARQNTAAPAVPAIPAHANPLNVLAGQNAAQQQAAPASVDQTSQQPNGQAAVNHFGGNLAASFAALSNMSQNPAMLSQGQSITPNSLSAAQNPLAALLPQAAPPPSAPVQNPITPDTVQQVQLLQLLAAQGIPQDQWATALHILSLSNTANVGVNMNPSQVPAYMPTSANQAGWAGRLETESRDNDPNRDREYMRSPPGKYRRRSRSPGWERRREPSPPRRRDSPVYGEYHADSPGRRAGDPRDTRGRRPNDYRARSPPGRRHRTPSPSRKDPTLPPPGPKFIDWDYSIGQGNMKG